MPFFLPVRLADKMKYITIVMLFLMAWALIVAANAVFNSILAEVNRMSSPDQQISPKWVRSKSGLVLQKHRDFFPESKKRLLSNLLALAAFTCAAAGVFLLIRLNAR